MRLRKNPIAGSEQRFIVAYIRDKRQTGSMQPLRTLTTTLEYDSLLHALTIPLYGFRTSTHNKFHSSITRFLWCTATYAATILPWLHKNISTYFALEWTRGCIRATKVERTSTLNCALCEPGVEDGTFMCNRENIYTNKQVIHKSFPHTCDIQIWINLPLHPSLQCCVISHSVTKPPHFRYYLHERGRYYVHGLAMSYLAHCKNLLPYQRSPCGEDPWKMHVESSGERWLKNMPSVYYASLRPS